MRVEHDPEANALYVYLHDAPFAYNTILDDRRVIDYAADGRTIGVEFLNVSYGVDVRDTPDPRGIGRAVEEHNLKVFAS